MNFREREHQERQAIRDRFLAVEQGRIMFGNRVVNYYSNLMCSTGSDEEEKGSDNGEHEQDDEDDEEDEWEKEQLRKVGKSLFI